MPFFFSLPRSRNSDPGSHSKLFSPPIPQRFVPCIFITTRIQLFLSSSTRVELCLPTLGTLSNRSFFIVANKFRISPRRDSKSRTNTSRTSIRGLPLDHGGDRLSRTGLEPQTPISRDSSRSVHLLRFVHANFLA